MITEQESDDGGDAVCMRLFMCACTAMTYNVPTARRHLLWWFHTLPEVVEATPAVIIIIIKTFLLQVGTSNIAL